MDGGGVGGVLRGPRLGGCLVGRRALRSSAALCSPGSHHTTPPAYSPIHHPPLPPTRLQAEAQILTMRSLLGPHARLVAAVCHNPQLLNTDRRLRSAAVLALTKLMVGGWVGYWLEGGWVE